jgi:hypothetical protein
VCCGDVYYFLVSGLVTSEVEEIEIYSISMPTTCLTKVRNEGERTAHAINNHQKVLLRIRKRIPIINSMIPTPDRPHPLIISTRKTFRSGNHIFQTLVVASEFPIHAERWLDDEAHVVCIGSRIHCTDWNNPVST